MALAADRAHHNWMSHSLTRLLLASSPLVALRNLAQRDIRPGLLERVQIDQPGYSLPALCNLIRLPNSIPLIRTEYIQSIDIFDKKFRAERSLLAFLGHFRADIQSLGNEYADTWSTGKGYKPFSIVHECNEIKKDTRLAHIVFRSLIHVGDAEMIQHFRTNVPNYHVTENDFINAISAKDPEILYQLLQVMDVLHPYYFWRGLHEPRVTSRFQEHEFRESYLAKARLEDSKIAAKPSEYLAGILRWPLYLPVDLECYRLVIERLIHRGHGSNTGEGILGMEIRDLAILSAGKLTCLNRIYVSYLGSQPKAFLELEIEEEQGILERRSSSPVCGVDWI